MRAVLYSRFHVCTSVAPIPMTMAFGLEIRVCVCMRTTLENVVLSYGQQPLGSAVNNFFDQGNFEFEAMKILVVGKLHTVMSINFVLKSR